MRILRTIRFLATATLLLVGFVSAEERDHGLTILSASPEEGLAGVYTTADSTILFETARAASPKNLKRARARGVEVSVQIRYAEGDLAGSANPSPPWGLREPGQPLRDMM